MNTLYRLGIQVFLVPLSQVYNTKHLSMQSTFKNIFQDPGRKSIQRKTVK